MGSTVASIFGVILLVAFVLLVALEIARGCIWLVVSAVRRFKKYRRLQEFRTHFKGKANVR